MSPDTPSKVICEFVIEKAPDVMPKRRAQLYRALAIIIGSEDAARKLNALADECDALDRHCRQLGLDLGDDSAPRGNGGSAS